MAVCVSSAGSFFDWQMFHWREIRTSVLVAVCQPCRSLRCGIEMREGFVVDGFAEVLTGWTRSRPQARLAIQRPPLPAALAAAARTFFVDAMILLDFTHRGQPSLSHRPSATILETTDPAMSSRKRRYSTLHPEKKTTCPRS